MLQIPKELVFAGDEGTYMTLCLDVTAYWRGSIFDRVGGLLDFHQQMATLIGDRITYYTTESMENAKKRNDETLALLPTWLGPKKRRRGIYILALESAATRNTPSDTGFYFYADEESEAKGGLIRLFLPVGFKGEDHAWFESLVARLLQDLDFDFATAGYSLNWDPNGDSAFDAQESFPFIARRFPGIDIVDYDATLYAVANASEPGIKCINWITVLGPSVLARLPAADQWQPALGPSCKVLDIGKGRMVVAGDQPRLGDTNRNEDLEAYHDAGKFLAPVRLLDHAEFIGAQPNEPDRDITADWLARFDN